MKRSGPWLASLSLLAAACAGVPAALSQPAPSSAPAAVVVHTDQPQGRFLASSVSNASVEALYGQVTSDLSEPFFQWVRVSNGLSHVRCYNWLGDGIPKGHPEWFSGCRVARRGPAGEPVYQWEGLERVLDTLVASGVTPVIVCGGIPDALAAGPVRRNEGGQAVNRPKDYAQYQELIAQMLRRLEKTYGAEEVRSWYFEVWSQPDHEGSWEGGRPAPFTGDLSPADVAPFSKLYDHFVAGAVSVDPKVRVGGPGLAGDAAFLRRFLEHCARETNAATGQKGTRLDFLSWHHYGGVADTVRYNEDLRRMAETDFPEFKDAPCLLTESGSSVAESPRANTACEAARMAALLDANARSGRGMDLLFRSGDLADDHFNGYRPLISRVGDNTVPLPAFRFNMLAAKLGAERLKTETPAGVGAFATRPSARAGRNATQVLLYRYDPALADGRGEELAVRLRVAGLPNTLLRLPMRLYRIDPEHGAPYEAWVAAGKPKPAPKELGQKLLGASPFAPADESPGVPINSGEAVIDLKLPPNSVALVTLGAETASEPALCDRGKRLRKAEAEFGAALQAPTAEKAIDGLRRIAERYADSYWREQALMALAGIYQLSVRSPEQAEAVRKELLTLPLDDVARLRLLQRLRVDAARKAEPGGVEGISRQIAELESRLAEQRQSTLRRYTGE